MVDARKPEEISAALLPAAVPARAAPAMGSEASRFARRYDLAAAVRETFDIYAQVVRASSRRGRV